MGRDNSSGCFHIFQTSKWGLVTFLAHKMIFKNHMRRSNGEKIYKSFHITNFVAIGLIFLSLIWIHRSFIMEILLLVLILVGSLMFLFVRSKNKGRNVIIFFSYVWLLVMYIIAYYK